MYLDYFRQAFWGAVMVLVVIVCIIGTSEEAPVEPVEEEIVEAEDCEVSTETNQTEQSTAPTMRKVDAVKKLLERGKLQPAEEPEITINEDDAAILAKLVWGEARGVDSTMEKAAVIWCVLNRVDADGYGDDIRSVVTAANQFTGYRVSNPVDPELYELAVDVLSRWEREKAGESDVGRVLPENYMYFTGDGRANHFRDAYRGGNRWDWSLRDPYAGGDL